MAALALLAALLAPAVAVGEVGADATADTAGSLDLTQVSLEQRDVRMFLRISTAGSWTHTELATSPGRSICVTLLRGEPAAARGRLCVVTRNGRAALNHSTIADDRAENDARPLAAKVSQPAPGVLQASFLPIAAGLSPGPYAFSAQSTWTDAGTCANACTDLLPDAGSVPAQLGLIGVPSCFGAAARDPAQPCENPELLRTVSPPPSRPKVLLDPYCDRSTHPGLVTTCSFGAPAGEAKGNFALIGDSHAASLKTPLEVVTLAKGWRGTSIFRATCPATQAAKPILRTRRRARDCVEWNDQVLDWLGDHREVQTVFLAAYAGAKVGRSGDQSMFEAMRAGYREEIRRLLRLVRRVVVIRDVPTAAPGHLACVAQTLKADGDLAGACTNSRGRAVKRDPLASAAAGMGSRVRVIDLTNRFCDPRRCFAVIGGALVHHDKTHMTTVFSATLGPFILRALGG
ncbi:MAG TPA: SGNH hydrolase domain-containing protein [Solirubrobacteraceae bacterium]|nr:SGNH hydrolase domain-containing protein [Solirubrobacteraceae bacterium]